MKCAMCPFGTKSSADGGNIRFCSGFHSRNIFAMSPMSLHTLVINGPNPHYLDRLQEGETSACNVRALFSPLLRGDASEASEGGRSHTICNSLSMSHCIDEEIDA